MNIVITGANRGIGLALTEYYLTKGHTVFAACRTASAALKASGATVIEGIDVSSQANRETLATALGTARIDLLINNAGILSCETLADMNEAALQRQLSINAIAPVMVCQTLQQQFASNAKIALITSRMGSIADNGSGAYYGYRMSKAALNAAGKSLAIDLKPRGIAVAILHPGFVQTDMVGGAGDISASTAAERLAARIDDLNINNSGTFWHSNGEQLPW